MKKGPRWPDGRMIAYEATKRGLTDRETTMEDTHVWVANADGSDRHSLGDALDNRQGAPRWSGDSRTIYFSLQEKGQTHLYRVPAAGGRPELAAQEREEITIISKYLPAQMTDQEIHDTIGALVKEIGATAMKDMGKVMAALKERYAGKLDFSQASGSVTTILSGG